MGRHVSYLTGLGTNKYFLELIFINDSLMIHLKCCVYIGYADSTNLIFSLDFNIITLEYLI